jgi:pyrroline-5-carboxylate reductase
MSDGIHDLAIIGAGNMAEAIARGVLKAKLIEPERMIAADVSAERRRLFQEELGISAVAENAEATKGAKMILLSVKPQQMENALRALRPSLSESTLIVSIAAGVGTEKIGSYLGTGAWRIVRAMPNTPMLVGEGMVALCGSPGVSKSDKASVRQLFEAAAEVIEVQESQMDVVTAVSGSGPAYVFYLAEQMIRAGEALGLTAEQSRALSLRTIAGAAKMLTNSAESPESLRKKVTSPNGTTQAAIEHMESQHVGQSIEAAIGAAAKRSRELGA